MKMEQKNLFTSVAKHFGNAAETYDLQTGIQKQAAQRLAVKLQGICDPGGKVLEIGCGTGMLTAELGRIFPESRITAVDIAGRMLEQARKSLSVHSNIEFVEADARELEAVDEFSLAVSSSALHWMLPLEYTFRKIKQFLIPEGILFFAMMVQGTLSELHQLRSEVAPHKTVKRTLPEVGQVTEALERAGLTLMNQELEPTMIRYDSAAAFLQALHQQGVTGGFTATGNQLTRGEIGRLLKKYEQRYGIANGGVSATYNVFYGKAVNQDSNNYQSVQDSLERERSREPMEPPGLGR